MFEIRYVSETDKTFWFALDKHISEGEFLLKVRDRRGYVISNGGKPIGVMRYNLFWDIIPFLTFIHLEETCRGAGLGKQAMQHWEHEMRALGHQMVMTSTQADEQAQHFYRKLGYKDRGNLFLDDTPFEQPPELLMLKVFSREIEMLQT